MNYIIYDVIIAAVLLFFVWLGYRKGLVLTLCSLLAVFVALIGASILSNALAEPAAKVVEPLVSAHIQQIVDDCTSVGVSSTGEVADHAPAPPLYVLLEMLEDSKLYHNLSRAFQAAVDEGVAEVTANAIQALARYAAVQIARIVIFAVAFIAVLIAWFFLSHALDLVAKLPVLSTLNRWGGAAAGLVKGALVLFILCWLLRDSCIPREAVEHSILLKFFCTAAPLSFFL